MKNKQDDSSLELLLDTICNIFGGIVLMALLVIIQTNTTAHEIKNANKRSQDNNKMQAMEIEHNQLSNQVINLTFECVEATEELTSHGSTEIVSLIKAFDDSEQQILEIDSIIQKTDQAIVLAAKNISIAEQQITKLMKSQHVNNSVIETLSEKIKAENNKPVNIVRLPFEHGIDAAIFNHYIIDDDRLYLIGPFENQTLPFVAGDCTVTAGSRYGSYHVTPIKSRGTLLSRAIANNIINTLDGYTNGFSLNISVGNESYKSFQQFKNYLIKNKFDYSIYIYEKKNGLSMSFVDYVDIKVQ